MELSDDTSSTHPSVFSKVDDEKSFSHYVTFVKDDIKINVPIFIPVHFRENVEKDPSFIPKLTTQLITRFPKVVGQPHHDFSSLDKGEPYLLYSGLVHETDSADDHTADKSLSESAETLLENKNSPETYASFLSNLNEVIEKSRTLRFEYGLSHADLIYYFREAHGYTGGVSSIYRFETFKMPLTSVIELKTLVERWVDEMSSSEGQRNFFNWIQFCRLSSKTRRSLIESSARHFATSKRKVRLNKSMQRTLEKCFMVNPRPNQIRKREISAETGLSLSKIASWFYNRRYRLHNFHAKPKDNS